MGMVRKEAMPQRRIRTSPVLPLNTERKRAFFDLLWQITGAR